MRRFREHNDQPIRGIGDFLARFKNFTPPTRAVARAVSSAIKSVLDVDIFEKEIRVAHGIAHISRCGVVKSEILLNKDAILTAARVDVGDSLKELK